MKVEEAMKMLDAGVTGILTSEEYRRYLKFVSSFYKYSPSNCMLIYLQRPDATLVAGYHDWLKKKRYVRRGAKAIRILCPVPVRQKEIAGDPEEKIRMYFRVGNIFDISQTEGEPVPTLEVNELQGDVEGYAELIRIFTELSPLPVRFGNPGGEEKGCCRFGEAIWIRPGMSELQTLKTLVHELAHALVHSPDVLKNAPKERWAMEAEAEGTAYVVLSHFRFPLDTSEYSFLYIAGWTDIRKPEEIRHVLGTIQKTAKKIIEKAEEVAGTESRGKEFL